MKMYKRAPLPFVGQKRNFVKEFISVIEPLSEDTIFVDLFGGSGLLSHITKRLHPNSIVVYNDYDNYSKRVENIPRTNELFRKINELTKDIEKGAKINGQVKAQILGIIEEEEQKNGYVDYITVSAMLLYPPHRAKSLEEMKWEGFYKYGIRMYNEASDYLEGLTIESCDYKELFNQWKENPNVVFIIDPPYLNTEVGIYTMTWKLKDYLGVLDMLDGTRFIYFTSNKTSIIELLEWVSEKLLRENQFANCRRYERGNKVNPTGKNNIDILLTNIEVASPTQ